MAKKESKKYSQKRELLWQKRYKTQRNIYKEIQAAAQDILQSENFNSTKEHIQHGNMTVNNHCMNVARYSLAFSRKLHLKCNERELIRGALLHDYFLYDWHDEEHIKPYKLHGYFHPGRALRNAEKEYSLTDRERDIIRKHMWPLTIVPPIYREGWIVTMVDKWCSFMETIRVHKGHGVIIDKLKEKGE